MGSVYNSRLKLWCGNFASASCSKLELFIYNRKLKLLHGCAVSAVWFQGRVHMHYIRVHVWAIVVASLWVDDINVTVADSSAQPTYTYDTADKHTAS